MSWPGERYEHRVALGQNKVDGAIITAKYPGTCNWCKKPFPRFATLRRHKGRWVHDVCANKASIDASVS